MSKDFNFLTAEKHNIRITTFGEKNLSTNKCLIFVHGFKGFKNWGFGPYLGNYLADKGFFVITFNFSHNGVGESLTDFDELHKFAENTFSRELNELSQIIDIYVKGYFGDGDRHGSPIENPKIGLIGHSRGGAIALLTAFQKPEVNSVVTWSAISKLDRYSKRQKEDWRKKGYWEVLNTRTNQLMRLNISLLEDIENNSEGKLNLEKAVKELNKPLLIIHGMQDLAVKIDEAEKIYEWSDKSKTEFLKIMKTGHTFDIVHPFESSNNKFERVLDVTNLFFQSTLK